MYKAEENQAFSQETMIDSPFKTLHHPLTVVPAHKYTCCKTINDNQTSADV